MNFSISDTVVLGVKHGRLHEPRAPSATSTVSRCSCWPTRKAKVCEQYGVLQNKGSGWQGNKALHRALDLSSSTKKGAVRHCAVRSQCARTRVPSLNLVKELK